VVIVKSLAFAAGLWQAPHFAVNSAETPAGISAQTAARLAANRSVAVFHITTSI
jgi:hypothetical protein